jgi:hypothetical protein
MKYLASVSRIGAYYCQARGLNKLGLGSWLAADVGLRGELHLSPGASRGAFAHSYSL